MSTFVNEPWVNERCVVFVAARATVTAPSLDVLELTRALAPFLAARPAEVTAALARCGVDAHRPPNAR